MKGPFRSPRDEETALLYSGRNFLKKKGIALVEVVVALALLAMMLILAVTVRFTLTRKDSTRIAQLSSSAALRKAAMAWQSDNLMDTNGTITNTNDFPLKSDDPNTNVIVGKSEAGEDYDLAVNLSTNTWMAYTRLHLEITVKDSQGVELAQAFSSRILKQPYPGPNTNVRTDPMSMNYGPSMHQLQVSTTSTGKGEIQVNFQTTGTNVTADFPHGTNVYLVPVPKAGYVFDSWIGADAADLNTSAPNSPTKAALYMDEDKTIEARFQ